MRIIWQEGALLDLSQVRAYIESENPLAAQEVGLTIIAAVSRLEDYPEMGRQGRVEGTRELVILDTPYIVVYCVEDNQIEILAVFHGSRRWPDEF